MSNIWLDIVILFGWTLLALQLAFRGVRFSFKQEAMA